MCSQDFPNNGAVSRARLSPGSTTWVAAVVLRVLILEDDAVTAMSLNNALTELGYEVCGHAYSGEGALLMAERTMPDLVVADICLAGVVDGIEAARRIKEKFGGNVVFTSALTDPATFRRAREVGRFLWKPYSNEVLAKAMQEAMASSH